MRGRRSFFRKSFTLLEVVVAIAILAIGAVAALRITASGTKRMNHAVRGWEVQHMLSQAAEYYLIAGPAETIPEEFFPFEGYQATCEIGEPDVSEDVRIDLDSGWGLFKLTIRIFNDEGAEVGRMEMDKILQTEDVK